MKLVCISYIGCCFSCEVGYVIDPLENIEPYLKVAKGNDIQITHIFNTHIQADHISGDKIYMHESANVSYSFEPVKEGM
jgi:glyoxylase-like metal-dependent hydrolase (beta-lactamase superfamily II)